MDAKMKRLAKRHYNGTCICYTKPGAGLMGTRESGRDCAFSKLSGREQKLYRSNHA